jgi:uncharacterized protein YdeI (YjbR/CyaY-like superfamily)
MDDAPRVRPGSRAAWRAWLARHHARRGGVWVVIDKKGARRPNLSAADVAEEALCFGWIDSLPRKRDAATWMLYVAPRKARSVWSALNKRRLARLAGEGRVAPAGHAAAVRARANGSWSAMEPAEALEVPADLAEALRRAPAKARAGWARLPPSARRGFLGWIALARRPETRAVRVRKIVWMAARGLRDPSAAPGESP